MCVRACVCVCVCICFAEIALSLYCPVVMLGQVRFLREGVLFP